MYTNNLWLMSIKPININMHISHNIVTDWLTTATITDWLSGTAITLSAIALIPQIYQIYTTRSARDVSFAMLAMLLSTSILQLAYGILTGKNGLPIVITNSISISLRLLVLLCKVYMDRQQK